MYQLKSELKVLEKLGINISLKSFRQSAARIPKVQFFGPFGHLLVPESDGFLMLANQQVSFAILVQAPRKDDLAFCVVQGRDTKNLITLGDQSRDQAKATYIFVAHSTTIVDGAYSTKYPSNSLRIISIHNGLLQMFEVGVVTLIYQRPDSQYFLTVQKLYESPLYVDEMEDVLTVDPSLFPGYDNWASLKELVNLMSNWKHDVDLPVWDDSVERPYGEKQKELGPNQARVLWYNLAWSIGKAQIGDNIYHMHWTMADVPERLPYFESGQIIQFGNIHSGPKGDQLIDFRPID